MNVFRFLNLITLFVIIMLVWTFLALIQYTNPLLWGKIGLPSLPPYQLWGGIYRVVEKVSLIAMVVIICVITFLWMIWKVINGLPGILKWIIGWVWWPWSDLDAAGILGLWDSMFNAIFSLLPLEQRLKLVGYGLSNFYLKSGAFAGKQFYDMFGLDKYEKKMNQDNDNYQDDGQNVITNEQQVTIDDKYSMCVEENVQVVTPEMGRAKVVQVNVLNNTAKIACKLERLNNSITFLTNHIQR